jgi:hypothetical protein
VPIILGNRNRRITSLRATWDTQWHPVSKTKQKQKKEKRQFLRAGNVP